MKFTKTKMISIALVLLMIIAFIELPRQKAPSKSLIGKWGGGGQNKDLVCLDFIDGSNVAIAMGPRIYEAKYISDTSKSPIPFDLSFRFYGKKRIVNGFIEIVDDTTLKWMISFDSNDSSSSVDFSQPVLLFRKN